MGGLSIAIGALVPSNVPNPRLLSRKSRSTKIRSGDSHPCEQREVIIRNYDKTVYAVATHTTHTSRKILGRVRRNPDGSPLAKRDV